MNSLIMIVLLISLPIVSGCSGNSVSDEEVIENTKSKVVEDNSKVEEEQTLETSKKEELIETTEKDEQNKEGKRDETLNGRGVPDIGRTEPKYVGIIGYAVYSRVSDNSVFDNDNFENTDLWDVPTYKLQDQSWEKTDITIPHKTEVLVKEQLLEHQGWGRYSGYLLVETIDENEEYYIDVVSFITKPYWTYKDDLQAASEVGMLIGEYNQYSDYYPVTANGEKVEIANGTKVLVHSEVKRDNDIDMKLYPNVAKVWKEWESGYEGMDVYFNSKDLTIVY